MTVYRIEHSLSKLGPFQEPMSEKTRQMLVDYWESHENVCSKFPPPDQDTVILENKKIPQNLVYKFACYSEEQIYLWLGSEVIKSLKKEGFEIVSYTKGVDFDYIIDGTNQCVIFFDR